MSLGANGSWDRSRSQQDLDARVTLDGKDLGFTISDMLPERRWAVKPTGEVLDRLNFQEQFRLLWMRGAKNENEALIPIPNAKEYVSQTINEEGRLVPIGWSIEWEQMATPAVPSAPVTITPTQAAEADKLGEIKVLTRLLAHGKISHADYAAEMVALTGTGGSAPLDEPTASEDGIEAWQEARHEEAVENSAKALHLSPREAEVYQRIDPSKPKQEQFAALAEEMGIKPAGVQTYYYSAKKKMEAGR